jgi:hypothetical protein
MIDARTTLLSGLVVLAFGCSSGGPLNIGNTGGQTPQLADYVGSWDGHAENWSFGSNCSDRVRLTIDAHGAGTLQVGNPTLPPATNANVEYPPGATGIPPNDPATDLWEGFPYPTHLTRVEAGRLQFGVDLFDIFSDWCALQTPDEVYCTPNYLPGEARAAVIDLPDGGTECTLVASDGANPQTIDCGKFGLCIQDSPCACDQSSCSSRSPVVGAIVPAQYFYNWDSGLDAQRQSMTAILVVDITERVTVHLTRVASGSSGLDGTGSGGAGGQRTTGVAGAGGNAGSAGACGSGWLDAGSGSSTGGTDGGSCVQIGNACDPSGEPCCGLPCYDLNPPQGDFVCPD